MRSFVLAAACAVLLLTSIACAPPSTIGPTVTHHRQALRLLADACAEDHDLILHSSRSHAQNARSMLVARLHRQMIERGYIASDSSAHPALLEADLEAQAPSTALAAEVRDGRMTREDARRFLEDYSLAIRMHAGGEVRRKMLGRLDPVRKLDARTAALEQALEDRRAAVLRLLDELERSGDALERYAAHRLEPDAAANSVARTIGPPLIASLVEEPARRAELQGALDALLASTFPTPIAPEETESQP